MNYPMDSAKICVIVMLSLSSKCEGTKQVRHRIPRNSFYSSQYFKYCNFVSICSQQLQELKSAYKDIS